MSIDSTADGTAKSTADGTSRQTTGPASPRGLGLALLVIAAAQLMLVLDDTIVNVAVPSIQRSLDVPPADLNWVISFYALAFGGLLLVGGRAGDLFGRLRVFRAGIALFTLASVSGGFAPNETALIVSRVVQGCGAALAAPCALSLLAVTFPEGPARTKALGVYGAMGGLGSVLGLLVGGALTEYASWRWVLLINAPIALLVLAGTGLGVLKPGETERARIDVPGAITATLGIGSLIYALSRGTADGWSDAGTLASFAAGAVLVASFLVIERRSRAPMLPSRLVADRNRGGANAVMLLLGLGLLAMFYLLTLYMQVVRHYSPLHTGLAYLPIVVGTGVAVAGLGPRLLAALPAGVVVGAGMGLGAGGLLWVALLLDPGSSYWVTLVPAMLAVGIGTGMTFIGCTVTGMRGVEPRESGVAAGLLNTSVQCGGALGLAALAAIASTVTRNKASSGHAAASALTSGYAAGLLAGAVIYTVAAVVAAGTMNARLTAEEATGH
jgi:EmrB/QacA subfamily drug resistance transporter